MRFLVTGATGHVGPELISILLERGHALRAVVRDRAAPLDRNVEVFAGDLNAARVALLSNSAAPSGDLSNAVAAYHVRSERALEQSGIPATLLRPNSFMSNALRWLPQIESGAPIREAFSDVPIATNDPRDIAAVGAVGLLADEPETRAYRITGPEALRAAQRVAILSEVLGRELPFEALSSEQARQQMSASMPDAYVDAFFDFFVEGSLDETTVLPTVEAVTGRPPRTFREWAQEHAGEFG